MESEWFHIAGALGLVLIGAASRSIWALFEKIGRAASAEELREIDRRLAQVEREHVTRGELDAAVERLTDAIDGLADRLAAQMSAENQALREALSPSRRGADHRGNSQKRRRG